jgi:hypothetical protein
MAKRRLTIGVLLFTVMILVSGPRSVSSAEVYYPWKNIYIGALEASSWAGLVFVPDNNSGFAFRLRVIREGEAADHLDFLFLVSEVGPHSPDGQYARLLFDMSLPFGQKLDTPILKKPGNRGEQLLFEWSRQDEGTTIGRISVPRGVELELAHYFPWSLQGAYEPLGETSIRGTGGASTTYHYLFWTDQSGQIRERAGGDFVKSFGSGNTIHFAAGVGDNERILENHLLRYQNSRTIDSFLNEEKKRYENKRVSISGLYEGVEDAITQNLFWNTLYQTGQHRFYSPAGRLRTYPKADGSPDDWTIFGWDSFLNALEVSIESAKYAEDIIRSVLETQYPNGNIPHWRGRFGGSPDRSQPPLGSFVVFKLFQKIGNPELLEYAYPFLVKWHEFWTERKPNGGIRRDGNRDGLLEWGSDSSMVSLNRPVWERDADGLQRAKWESGQEDLPNWDQAGFSQVTGTMTMNCVDLNSLYALDSWCLAQIAAVLDRQIDYEKYSEEYNRTKELVNRLLWDEQQGFYYDRHWSGRFSRTMSASNFYPLLARIPDQNRALEMLKKMLDPDLFWGEYILPTVSRDDPAFADQQYWRGAIWAPTNYLVYQGLKAYSFDAAAAEFAAKSQDIFMKTWENFQLCPENFDSRTGEAGGQRFLNWGPLCALIALEEYIDFSPLDGFRFGMIEPERKGTLSRVSILGRHYDVKVSTKETWLKEEGRVIVQANGGAVFRRFLYSENEVAFEMTSLKSRKVYVRFLTKGKYELMVDDETEDIVSGSSVKFSVPEGTHRILLLQLEKK